PVKEFQQEYQNLRLARLTGQFSDYTAILRDIVRKLGGEPPENAIKTLTECRYSAGAAHLRRIEPEILICSMKSPLQVLDSVSSVIPRALQSWIGKIVLCRAFLR
ncbi:MAG: hypothetical protein OYL97_02575, partial [Candidatus Poribacteria bacterium]|nr:hypothetical protein [Candidatus Poribacteria bacterium]